MRGWGLLIDLVITSYFWEATKLVYTNTLVNTAIRVDAYVELRGFA